LHVDEKYLIRGRDGRETSLELDGTRLALDDNIRVIETAVWFCLVKRFDDFEIQTPTSKKTH
jgi:hypothetical protein